MTPLLGTRMSRSYCPSGHFQGSRLLANEGGRCEPLVGCGKQRSRHSLLITEPSGLFFFLCELNFATSFPRIRGSFQPWAGPMCCQV